MSLSHDRVPESAPQAPETSVCQAAPAQANLGAADYPIVQGGGAEAAGAVLAADTLAEFYYEALVQDPIANLRDVLFTCYLHNWPGFNQMLGVVDAAARAELDATEDTGRVETLTSLRPGLAAGKAALRQEATPFELDILLGALDPSTAPLTADFVTLVYEAASLRLAHQLREHATGSGDSELLGRAHQLMSLLGVGGPSSGDVCPAEEPTDDASGWDKIVDWAVSGAGGLVDSGVDALAGTPVLGDVAAAVAPGMKFGQEFVGGVAKGAGDMVGGLATMATQPIATLKGIGAMLEHLPGSPLKSAHKLYDVAAGDRTLEESFLRNPLTAAREDLAGDWDFWKQLGGAMLEPYRESIREGKTGEAIGRGVFDVGSMFIGAGEIKALGKGAKIASKLDDATLAVTKVDGFGGVADEAVRAGEQGDELAALGDEAEDISKASDAISPHEDDAAILESAMEKAKKEAMPTGPREPQLEAPDPTSALESPQSAVSASRASEAAGELVDFSSPSRRTHILDGDIHGGGHRAGTGVPGKTEFPASWSDDQIMQHVSDIVTDPMSTPAPNNSTRLYDRSGRPVRNAYLGVRDGVQVQVVVEPATGEIISAYPVGVIDPTSGQIIPYPRNPAATP